MRRRAPLDPSSVLTVPPDIAAGPEVRRWAAREALQVLDGARAPALYAHLDPVNSAMLDAWRRWRAARDEWAAQAGLTPRERLRAVPNRQPYFTVRPKVRSDETHRSGPVAVHPQQRRRN